jgi:hypothetical protein
MAARTRRIQHDDATRARIQTSQLVNRLQANGLGKLKAELSASQVKSIEILLRKTMPDMTATDITSKGGPIQPVLNVSIAPKP